MEKYYFITTIRFADGKILFNNKSIRIDKDCNTDLQVIAEIQKHLEPNEVILNLIKADKNLL